MGGVNRRELIKNVTLGATILGLGGIAHGTTAPASTAPNSREPRDGPHEKRMPEIIASCHCKKVVLRLTDLDPRFDVCHCGSCQMLHNGPWYGARCADVEIIDGEEHVAQIPMGHGKADQPVDAQADKTTWQFCSNCGSRLFYDSNAKATANGEDRYDVSLGLIHLICPKEMVMEREVYFDMKPDYYAFHETKKTPAG